MASLQSYLSGAWTSGAGKQNVLVNPSTEEPLAETSTEGLDLAGTLAQARAKGGPALRALTFEQRAEILKRLAKAVGDAREELIALGIANAGNTRSDAKFDIDGAAATLMFYAELGTKLGTTRILADGEGVQLGRSARLFGQHVFLPRQGVALHINAFNFPAWGMAEKLAVSLLAGVPVISKPATATALMAHQIAQLWVATGALPEGAFSFVCGGAGNLVSLLTGQDVLAFTGSGSTAAMLRRQENLALHGVHVNVEADSLNAALLGPDVEAGSDTFNFFLGDVAKELTQKTGQKCTAVRRIFVQADRLSATRDALMERLADVRVGNPADEKVTMGPLATAQQLADVRAGIDRLAAKAKLLLGGSKAVEGLSAPIGKGYFVAPTLLEAQLDTGADHPAHTHEVFGPVATLIPYRDTPSLVSRVAAGGGGLVSALYTDDRDVAREVVMGIGPYHGRLTLGTQKLAGQAIPPGTVMPQLLHGGPGRAGGGEELGAQRGLALYMQRVALQGDRALIEHLLAH